jgi:hypothetical protein
MYVGKWTGFGYSTSIVWRPLSFTLAFALAAQIFWISNEATTHTIIFVIVADIMTHVILTLSRQPSPNSAEIIPLSDSSKTYQ